MLFNEQDESIINDEVAASLSLQRNKQQEMLPEEFEGVEKISDINNKSIFSTLNSTPESIGTISPSKNVRLVDASANFTAKIF